MSILDKKLRVKFSDGSQYDVPVQVIAANMAEYYAHRHEGDTEAALKEDVLPLLESSDYEVEDWAKNNMNWDDVKASAIRVAEPSPPDYDDEWCNAEMDVVP